ncbi:hypothetical protein J4P41_05990 [Gluconobacter sp. NFX36]|uniref:Phosphate starvation-inducible protein PsiF n=1 Tax=Gluconobacter japonicus TaxID=376620 RepID=A0ABQ5WMS0_GLUJA|nr:hypothetical protein [Gluconobacter japonicus]KXV25878.1 hypothetical protein AD938_10875 [Gluconobacter japonicus]MBS1050674.1 hypothetical protein [Gluconobacter japonicus]GBR19525.1 hypothetical protein AA3271_0494 [Gluconobacter japonicus NBRC 3271]GLQ61004.1 hypothetical protein GCM10010937_28070 [Gluconobacter japonicus]
MTFRKVALLACATIAFGGQLAHAKSQPCRDAKGKFTKCEAPKKPKPCRDAKGKFTKCDAPAPQAAQPSN